MENDGTTRDASDIGVRENRVATIADTVDYETYDGKAKERSRGERCTDEKWAHKGASLWRIYMKL